MRKHFLQRTLITFAFILLLCTLAACIRPDSGNVIPPVNRQQLFQLQGQIQQGPAATFILSGELRTTIDAAGRLQGTLIRESGSPITVTGQIDGQAIHLAFDLGHNAAVLGVGTLQHDINNAQGTAGGLLTGPQPGDSGDWFARWTTIVTPATPSPTQPVPNDNTASSTNNLILMLGIITVMLLAGALLRQTAGKSLYSRTRGRSAIPFIKASAQTVEPERWPEEAALPLAQFATTYAYGDDHYDLSFTIESARGDFLGECGAGITSVAGNTQPKSVTALEVWVFDKNDIDTITKVLRSVQGFYNPSQRSSRDPVNEVLVIAPDQTLVLETKTLRMRVKVLAVEYIEDPAHSQSVFKQVSLKLAVWIK